jgi:hypothetical protein
VEAVGAADVAVVEVVVAADAAAVGVGDGKGGRGEKAVESYGSRPPFLFGLQSFDAV